VTPCEVATLIYQIISATVKIYGKTTSDRSSKGQGGNHHVSTVFTVEHDNRERVEIATTTVERGDNEYTVRHIPVVGDATVYSVPIRKA